jgi:hypothetical protein
MKPRFLLQIDLSGTINCNTFSVVPSIINENAKNVLFHFAILMSVIAQNVIMQSGICTECCGAKIKGQCIFFVSASKIDFFSIPEQVFRRGQVLPVKMLLNFFTGK